MPKRHEIADCWTQNELRSLVEAMTKRSIFDSEVDYIDNDPQDFNRQEEQNLPTEAHINRAHFNHRQK